MLAGVGCVADGCHGTVSPVQRGYDDLKFYFWRNQNIHFAAADGAGISLVLSLIHILEEKDFYGDSLQEVEKAYPHVGFGNKVRFMTIGDYNRIARLYGKDTYELKKDQYMVIADYKQMVLVRNIPLGRGQSLEINGKKYIPKYRDCLLYTSRCV